MPQNTKPQLAGFSNTEWLRLCTYVQQELLQYPAAAKFPRAMALRLRGLAKGQFCANHKQPAQAEYGYDVLYRTAIACKPQICDYLTKNAARIQDENHKINLILRFMEQQVNNIYLQHRQRQHTGQRAQGAEISASNSNAAPYSPKSTALPGMGALW